MGAFHRALEPSCLRSLSKKILKAIRVTLSPSVLFLFIAGYYLAVYLHHTGSPPSPVDRLSLCHCPLTAAHAPSAKHEGSEPGDSRVRVSIPPRSQQHLLLPFKLKPWLQTERYLEFFLCMSVTANAVEHFPCVYCSLSSNALLTS